MTGHEMEEGDTELVLLPDEVWMLVFQFLLPSDWCCLSLVDKRFLNLAQDDSLWETIIPPLWKDQILSFFQHPQAQRESNNSAPSW